MTQTCSTVGCGALDGLEEFTGLFPEHHHNRDRSSFGGQRIVLKMSRCSVESQNTNSKSTWAIHGRPDGILNTSNMVLGKCAEATDPFKGSCLFNGVSLADFKMSFCLKMLEAVNVEHQRHVQDRAQGTLALDNASHDSHDWTSLPLQSIGSCPQSKWSQDDLSILVDDDEAIDEVCSA
jgi:hypothetical protein